MPVPDPKRDDDPNRRDHSDRDRVTGTGPGAANTTDGPTARPPTPRSWSTYPDESPAHCATSCHIRAIHEGRPLVELLRDAISQYLEHNQPIRSNR